MQTLIKAALVAAILIPAGAYVAQANVISSACLKADRKAATRQLCGCIQQAANQTLSKRDQRTAAKFFADPHVAQETRQSDNRSKERFWKRYIEFTDVAVAYCG